MNRSKILIVEDEAVTAMDLEKRLTHLDYEVVGVANNGEDAVQLAKEKKPDLILMDIFLGSKMDGIDAAKIIGDSHHIPIVFLTAYNDDTSFSRAKNCNPFAYIAKPFETRDLYHAIELSLLKHKTQLLQARAMLNDKLAIIGTLTTGIMRELSHPLSWILSHLDEARQKMESIDHNNINASMLLLNVQENVQDSMQNANQILEIVRNLKSFIRDKDEYESVDIHSVIDESIKMAYPQFKYKTKIEKIYSGQLPKMILNKNKLHHVFLNLIVNSSDAMNENYYDKNLIQIKTEKLKNRVSIMISDTGCGIAEENLTKIFDPFFTTKAVGVGIGLGLSICKEIVESLGGEILVQSQLNQGSTFKIILPESLNEVSQQ